MRGFGKTLLGAAMAVGAMSSVLPAYSADMPRRNNSFAPAPIFSTSWAGFYAGGHLGYVFGRARSADMDGFKGGLQAGYNFQMDRLVIGGEADIAYSGVDYRGFTESFRQKWIGSGRVRLGYAFERFLPFVTAGFAYTTGTMKAGGAKQSNGHVGYVVGLGGEMMLSDRVSASVQYLHYRFEGQTYSVVPARNANIVNNEIRVGLNYRF